MVFMSDKIFPSIFKKGYGETTLLFSIATPIFWLIIGKLYLQEK